MQEAAQSTDKTVPIEFTGKSLEFFGIWIVNILLTILTLGIYTAWAKVRTKRYFYGNTLIDGSPFDYLADPLAILKGWLIAVVVFIVYSVAVQLFPPSQLIFMLVFLAVLPWLVVRSMAFRARNTAYRNIRFTFNGTYGQAAKIYIGLALLAPFTLGLIYPYVVFRQKQFLVNRSTYGTSPFSFSGDAKSFYKIYLIVGLLLVMLFVLMSVVMVPMFQEAAEMSRLGAQGDAQKASEAMGMAVGLFYLLFFGFYFIAFAYLQARINNLIWNNTEIGGNRFISTMRARDLTWIYFSNLLAIVFSAGLLVPWAKIRLARYRFSRMKAKLAGDLDGFVQAEKQKTSAMGEEVGEVFDIDIGL